MEEEEEVDIVGGLENFMHKNDREISNIDAGQILSCEYTVHPQWLNDNNDGAELWPENLPKQSSQDEMELVQDEVVIEEPEPIEINWTDDHEHEEVSNCGDIIFEQDIPASLEEEVVTNSGTEDTECDNNSDYNGSQSTQNMDFESDSPKHLPDAYVPMPSSASVVGTATKVERRQRPLAKFKQTLILPVSRDILKLNQRKFNVDLRAGTSLLKPVIREQMNDVKRPTVHVMTSTDQSDPDYIKSILQTSETVKVRYSKKSKVNVHSKKIRLHGGAGSGGGGGKSKSGKVGSAEARASHKFVDLHGANITINHEADESRSVIDKHGANVTIQHDGQQATITKAIEPSVEMDQTEQTTIQTIPTPQPIQSKSEEGSESDVEVDIESDTPNDLIETSETDSRAIIPAAIQIVPTPQQPLSQPLPVQPIQEKVPPIKIKTIKRKDDTVIAACIETLEPELQQMLNDTTEPTAEFNLSPEISPLEKYMHAEFFEGRPTKTPERFLKIRDYIVNAWNEGRPTYISKTTVRNGLKHCGDVNCISRIHCMLEQVGAINFGYSGEHFQYIRPLSKLKEHFVQSVQNKKAHGIGAYEVGGSMVLGRRQRNKSVMAAGSAYERDIDANYTVSHVNGVSTLLYAALPKDRENLRREASKPLKMEFELIECLRFAKDKIPPFKISMTLSTLLCLHLHALSSSYEVMGFLGGYCTKSVGRSKLSLTRYKPTKTASQTGTTCEMCPVSQVEQAANLTSEGYELVGWFHSHPTFEANPSRTDVATQADMQLQFSMESDRPFIGFILNCQDMHYNCMYILQKDIHKDTTDIIPYGFEVDIIKDCSSLHRDIADVFNVIDRTSPRYVQTIEKFLRKGSELLSYHGYELNIGEYLSNYI